MPLKDVDLKTFEAYKKAIRQDVTKIGPTTKTKFWVYKDINLPDQQGKPKLLKAFVALVDDRGVRQALRNKKLVCLGTCRLEQGKVAFDPVKGKVPYNTLKVSVPLLLGKMLFIPPNASPEDDTDDAIEIENEADDNATEDKPSNGDGKPKSTIPVPPPQPQTSPLAGAWSKLSRDTQAAIAANPARKDALTRAAAGIAELLNSNPAEAKKRMDALSALLTSPPTGQPDAASIKAAWGKLVPNIKLADNAALTQAAADASKQIPELMKQGKMTEAQAIIDQLTARVDALKSQPKPSLTAADISAAWRKLVPEVEQKSKVQPDLKDAALRVRKQIEELIKAGKFGEAQKAIDGLADLLSKAGSDTTKTKPEDSESREEGSPPNPQQAEYERKRKQMDADILRALKNQIGDVSRIRAAVALAEERAEGGDYASALKVLVSLSELIEQGEIDDDDQPAPGLVEYRKSLFAFEKARRAVEAQLDQLTSAIPTTLPDEAEFADELADEIGEQIEELQELIEKSIEAANDEKAPVNSSLKDTIEATLNDIRESKLLAKAETNTFGVPVTFRKTLVAALEEILKAIPVEV